MQPNPRQSVITRRIQEELEPLRKEAELDQALRNEDNEDAAKRIAARIYLARAEAEQNETY